MAKLCVVFGNGILSNLTMFFTGSRAYHSYWKTDEHIYEMALQGVRRDVHKYDGHEVVEFDFPEVTTKYLEHSLTTDLHIYGWLDYLLFAVRPVYHLFGQSTRNQGGIICSEKCNDDLWNCGYKTPWKRHESPPSPADQARWINIIVKSTK